MKNIIKSLFISLVLSLATFYCIGQRKSTKAKCDSVLSISKSMFDSLVDFSIIALKTKNLHQISDSGNIIIMLCNNTIAFTHNFDSEHHLAGDKFSDGRYSIFMLTIDQTNYISEITKIYPDFKLNKGLGYYFPKLDMDLGGTPKICAMYNVR